MSNFYKNTLQNIKNKEFIDIDNNTYTINDLCKNLKSINISKTARMDKIFVTLKTNKMYKNRTFIMNGLYTAHKFKYILEINTIDIESILENYFN